MGWNPEEDQPGWQPDGWQPSGGGGPALPDFVGPNIDDIALRVDAAMTPVSYAGRFTAPNPLTYAITGGSLPPGLALSASGVLSGTPTVVGIYTGIVVHATDGTDTADSNAFSITVSSLPTPVGPGGTSGTYTFDPQLNECLDEAFERIDFSPEAIERRHIQAAIRSVKFLFSEWQTIGMRQWMIHQYTVDLTPGQMTFTLPAGAIDIFDMTFKRGGVETEVSAIARDVYFTKHKKDLNGRVIEYMLDRAAGTKTVYLWPRGERTGDQLLMNYVRQIQDPGTIANTLQLPPFALEAFIAGLAARLALKFKPERFAMLQAYYRGPDPDRIGGQLKLAIDEDRENVDLVCQADYSHRRQGSW